jgi:hypothetical protein
MEVGIVKLKLKVFDNIKFYNGTFAYLAICNLFLVRFNLQLESSFIYTSCFIYQIFDKKNLYLLKILKIFS